MSSKQSGQKMLSFFIHTCPNLLPRLGTFFPSAADFCSKARNFCPQAWNYTKAYGRYKRTLKTIAGIKYNTQEAIDEVTQQRTKSGYK